MAELKAFPEWWPRIAAFSDGARALYFWKSTIAPGAVQVERIGRMEGEGRRREVRKEEGQEKGKEKEGT